eukprot:1304956-Rhodomonas_salina.1
MQRRSLVEECVCCRASQRLVAKQASPTSESGSKNPTSVSGIAKRMDCSRYHVLLRVVDGVEQVLSPCCVSFSSTDRTHAMFPAKSEADSAQMGALRTLLSGP